GTHDDESHAKVSVSLSRVRGATLPADQVVGPQTWTGLLCDGSTATVNFTVNADGTISGASSSVASAQITNNDGGLRVRFSDHESVRIGVRVQEDGQMRLDVKERIRCDSPNPNVNTPVSTNPDHSDDHNGGFGDHFGDHEGDHHGDHEGDNGGSTSTTTPTTTSS